MIPKIIHYCWFGKGEKSKLTKKCIDSWRKYCPEYEIKEWNEKDFDINMNNYTKKCIADAKYAFLSDYARLVIIERCGGIYLDTDVEVIKNFDDLLANEAFFGFENNQYVATGLGFGAEKNHITVQAMLKEYDCILDGQHEFITCPELNTNALLKLGLQQNGKLQNVAGAQIYPSEYFNPYDDPTGILRKTSNTISIHWYSKSWLSKSAIVRSRFTKPFHRILGVDCFKFLRRQE